MAGRWGLREYDEVFTFRIIVLSFVKKRNALVFLQSPRKEPPGLALHAASG